MSNFVLSFQKNKKGIILIILASIFVCFGQLFWKMSESNNIILILLGFALYTIGALTMIFAYRFGSLSVLQPFLSASYVLSTILGFLVLNEPLLVSKIIGIFIIIIGIIMIGGGDN
jgi:drug/metabolite transporter (DMT)-like permease